MALEKLTQDVANISKLDNYPPDDPGMTPDKLKQLFDKGSNTIKDYINNTLVPQLEEQLVENKENANLAEQKAGEAEDSAIKAEGYADLVESMLIEVNNLTGQASASAASASASSSTALNFMNIALDASTQASTYMDNAYGAMYTAQARAEEAGSHAQTAKNHKDYIITVLIPLLESNFIDSIARTSGDGSPGSTDTYTITFHDGSTKTFQVYNGRDGKDGVDGAKGDAGNGIASVSLNEDYTLTINFTNGDTYTTPVPIRGEKGDKGDKGDKGEKGDTGAVPNISIGTTTTLAAGSNATVNRRSGSPDTAPIFDFGIPKGLDGKDGKDGKDAVLPFDIWAGTLAEYNALPYEQRNNPNFVHCIYEE